jgi:uncharacterized membrane protein
MPQDKAPGSAAPTPVATATAAGIPASAHHFRFHEAHRHLASPFGTGGFGEKAELFARFFGTPKFLLGQTVLVAAWIAVNSAGLVHFDIYPFILLNLAFSLQAAYAAPLILLAQTRQADRDKAHAEADALHREDLARQSLARQDEAVRQNAQMQALLEQNTELTTQVQGLAAQIEKLTREIHGKVCETGR